MIRYLHASRLLVFLLIIILHGSLRLSEIPFARVKIGQYFWAPSINLAANKGFVEDTSFVQESPELSDFLNSMPLGVRPNKKLSPVDTLYSYKDYTVKTDQVYFHDSVGYRFIIGEIWKYFGFNWYFVGLFNYFLSLLALLALMYCSYKTLGFTSSIIIGCIFSLSVPEITFMVRLGRDGIPFWFASYLICALIMFVSKPLRYKRIAGYALLIGIIIFGSIQGRNSSICFLPLVFVIYFLLFSIFQKERIQSRQVSLFKNSFSERVVLFLFCVIMTSSFAIIPNILIAHIFPHIHPNGMMGVVFEGLGVWGEKFFHPSQVRYLDEHTIYLAQEYGQRVFHYTDTLSLLKADYVLLYLYLLIIKTYPLFFFEKVLYASFNRTLIFLSYPYYTTFGYSSLFDISQKIFLRYFLFIFTCTGAALLYWKIKLKKISIILICFVFFNAIISFFQCNARHALMGHPAYYFLTGTTLSFIYENYIKTRKNNILKDLSSLLRTNQKFFGRALLIILIVFCFLILLRYIFNYVEQKNTKEAQTFFSSLEKKPLNFEAPKKLIKPSSLMISKTIGIYCEIGKVTKPKKVSIDFALHGNPSFYHTEILPIVGQDVTLFIPLYFMSYNDWVKFEDNGQCQSFYWSDLKNWKGPLWEGSYDKSTLKK